MVVLWKLNVPCSRALASSSTSCALAPASAGSKAGRGDVGVQVNPKPPRPVASPGSDTH